MTTSPAPTRLHKRRFSFPSIRNMGIRGRLLVLLLSMASSVLLLLSYLGFNITQGLIADARQISSDALHTQAENYLRQITADNARRYDQQLSHAALDIQNLATYASYLFENSEQFPIYWRVEEHMDFGPENQYKNGPEDLSSVYVPNFQEINAEVIREIELSAYLDPLMASLYENNDYAAIFLDTENHVTRYYPNINLWRLLPPDFSIKQRPWYVKAAPSQNPERAVAWSPIYEDATGKGLLVTVAAPIYVGTDRFIGNVGIDITLQDITAEIEQNRMLNSGYSFLIENSGRAIALPEQGYYDILGRAPLQDEVGTDLNTAQAAFVPTLERMKAGATGLEIITVNDRKLFVAYTPLESAPWSLANVIEAQVVLQTVATLEEALTTTIQTKVNKQIIPITIATMSLIAIAGLLISHRMAAPIKQLAQAARQIEVGQWDIPLPPVSQDEIGMLTEAFRSMATQLKGSLEELEQRISERTKALERRTVQMEASAQVARQAAAIRDVKELVNATVHLISEEFGFYHAGLFLLDETKTYAVLKAASSEGGQRMLARSHQLKVGEEGIVGYVAATGRSRIALDVGEDAVFFNNPDLPLTRSEIALPLKIRGEVIGVLDVQSTEAGAFSENDAAILQTMADQVALAIENARLVEQTQANVHELNILLGQYSREEWRRLTRERPTWGYAYDGIEVLPVSAAHKSKEPEKDEEKGATPEVTLPLQVRDATIGQLKLLPADPVWDSDMTALVQAVAEQAAQALENARLFQETQRTLSETNALYHTSRAIGVATSVKEVEQALIAYLSTSGVDAARILFLEYDEQGEPTHIVMGAGWTVDNRPAQPEGTRLPLTDYPLRDYMTSDEPLIFEDVLTDPRANEATRTLIARISGLRSFVMIPIATSDRWLGTIFVGRNLPFTFSPETLRGYETVASQAAVTLESLRLLEETRRRAERERMIAEITTRIRQSLDIESVLTTAANEIGVALGLATVELRLGNGSPDNTRSGVSEHE